MKNAKRKQTSDVNSAKQPRLTLPINSVSNIDTTWEGIMWYQEQYVQGTLPYSGGGYGYGYIFSFYLPNSNDLVQIAIPYSGDSIATPKFRTHVNGSWQSWREFCDKSYMLQGGTQILPEYNLNDYRNPGNYYISSNSNATSILNVPVNIAGTVKVECGNGISYPRQIYISYTGREGYIRYFDGETWSSWKSMFGL